MVQPSDPPLSIRPGAERLAKIDAWAAKQKVTRHAAILSLIDRGLAIRTSDLAKLSVGEPVAVWPQSLDVSAGFAVSVPLYAPKAFNPQPKKGTKK